MIRGRRFAPGWLTTIAAVGFVALTLSLGQWQTRRAATKLALQEAVERGLQAPPIVVGQAAVSAAEASGRRIVAHGEYDPARGILLDNRVLRGRPGYEVVTPLRLAGGERLLLVNRGWVAAGRTRDELPAVPTPVGPVTVQGVAVVPPQKVFELGDDAPGRRWQHLLLDRYATWAGAELEPFVVQQTNDAADGLVRDWPRPDLGVDKHRAYALQWYAFALLTVILYVVLNFRRDRAPSP
jgi:surfeit locus 1 family protein